MCSLPRDGLSLANLSEHFFPLPHCYSDIISFRLTFSAGNIVPTTFFGSSAARPASQLPRFCIFLGKS